MKMKTFSQVFLRTALSVSFLSAVAYGVRPAANQSAGEIGAIFLNIQIRSIPLLLPKSEHCWRMSQQP